MSFESMFLHISVLYIRSIELVLRKVVLLLNDYLFTSSLHIYSNKYREK